jgi:hypothetical protein
MMRRTRCFTNAGIAIDNAHMEAVGIGLELLGSAEPDQEIPPLNVVKRQARQNDDSLFAAPPLLR